MSEHTKSIEKINRSKDTELESALDEASLMASLVAHWVSVGLDGDRLEPDPIEGELINLLDFAVEEVERKICRAKDIFYGREAAD